MANDHDRYDRGIQVSWELLDRRDQAIITYLIAGLGAGATAALAGIVATIANPHRYPLLFWLAFVAALWGLNLGYRLLLQQRHRAATEAAIQSYYPALGAFIDSTKFSPFTKGMIGSHGHNVGELLYSNREKQMLLSAIVVGDKLMLGKTEEAFKLLLGEFFKLRDLRSKLDTEIGNGVTLLTSYTRWFAVAASLLLLLVANWESVASLASELRKRL